MKNKAKWYFTLIERIVLVICTILSIVPVYLLVSNSFRRTIDMREMPPDIFFKPVLTHFKKIFEGDNFGVYLVNSVIITGTAVILTLIVATLAAYGLKLFKSSLGNKLSNMMLIGKLLPAITILIPIYTMFNKIGLLGTYWGPVLIYTASTLPFITWLISSFMQDIPMELLESACLDGCSRMKSLFSIITPLLRPAIASAALMAMQFAWNDLLYALQLTNIKTYTLTVAVARYAGAMDLNWGKSAASATITMIPLVVFGFIMQKYLVVGLTAGAVKG